MLLLVSVKNMKSLNLPTHAPCSSTAGMSTGTLVEACRPCPSPLSSNVSPHIVGTRRLLSCEKKSESKPCEL